METKINIAVVEDHNLVRELFVPKLNEQPGFRVVFDACNGKEFFAKLKHRSIDIVLLDVSMPVMDGEEVMKILRLKFPAIKVIIVSGLYSPQYVNRFLKLGAAAYLPKIDDLKDVVKAIKSVYVSGKYIDKKGKRLLTKSNKQVPLLTARQLEILKMISEGKTSKEIGKILLLNKETIDYHRNNLMHLTDTPNIQALIAYCVKNSVI